MKIIKDWNNLPNHLFTDEIRLSNLLSMQNGDIFQPQTNHMSVDWVSHLGGLEFFPQENFEILMVWKDVSSVLRGQFCPKLMFAKSHKSIAILCLIFFFACFRIRVLNFNISYSFKVFWTSILVEQGSALAEPSGLWCLTFVLRCLENLSFFFSLKLSFLLLHFVPTLIIFHLYFLFLYF